MSTQYFDNAGVTPVPAPVGIQTAEPTAPFGYGLIAVAIGWAALAVMMLAIGGAVFVGIFEAVG